MTNPSKQRGTRFETEVVEFLKANGFPDAERRALAGSLDKGDVMNVPDFTLECKNEATMRLAAYMAEAAAEAINAKTPFFAAIVKRRGKGARDAYVVMPLYEVVALIKLAARNRTARSTPATWSGYV